jgi:hypothetical protein
MLTFMFMNFGRACAFGWLASHLVHAIWFPSIVLKRMVFKRELELAQKECFSYTAVTHNSKTISKTIIGLIQVKFRSWPVIR